MPEAGKTQTCADTRFPPAPPAPARVKKVLDLTGIIGREGITLADD